MIQQLLLYNIIILTIITVIRNKPNSLFPVIITINTYNNYVTLYTIITSYNTKNYYMRCFY